MTTPVHNPPNLIYSEGTQVVLLRNLAGSGGTLVKPQGAVGVVLRAPADLDHDYRIAFLDGTELAVSRSDLTLLAEYKQGSIADAVSSASQTELFARVILRCVVGSRAFGLEGETSDTDVRGIYLPPTELKLSLYGVPDQIDNEASQELYWEFERFMVLALKANPNVLECLYTPLVQFATELGREMIEARTIFLSRLVYQTYNGYVASQFKKMQADLRNHGQVKWKHVMHLIRLLISGIDVLRDGIVAVRMDRYRELLLAIKRGEVPWEETERMRLDLHKQFDAEMLKTRLPERPDYAAANQLLIRARRLALEARLP